MKTKSLIFSFITTALICCLIISCGSEKTKSASFDYFGLTLPGNTPEPFAPGLISVKDVKDAAFAISPAGDEVFFVRGTWPATRIMHMERSESGWSEPDTAKFSQDCWTTEPAFSPDGQYLYFSSSKGKSYITNYSLWRIRKTDAGWSEPESLFDIGGSSVWEFHPSVSSDGSLFFCWWDTAKMVGDIYVSQCNDEGCSDPVRIGGLVNTESTDADPYADPDGEYIIYSSARSGGYGMLDNYISFRKADGTWTDPENMGYEFNTEKDDYDLDISPDGRYVFLYLNDDIYWRQTGDVIEKLRGSR